MTSFVTYDLKEDFFKSTQVLLDNKSLVGDKTCGICDFLIKNLFVVLARELKINYKFIGHPKKKKKNYKFIGHMFS